ncbi:Sulfide:quinone oxidoreductase, mitochondrial [Halotydeus destructor]|nr:Sulfide:quinone oxidoreductase, mitochondrial [Halotydeus destructor]
MAFILRNNLGRKVSNSVRHFSSNSSFKLVVVGGGSGGIPVAARFAKVLPKGSVALVEPRDDHYYQPMWSLVGGGIKKLSDTRKSMQDVVPRDATWIKDKVSEFQPESNTLKTSSGQLITYDYLVVAMGIQLQFDKVKGLISALNTDGVCSNYSSETVEKTWRELQNFKEGNAIFTFPCPPIKCAGAPQKIMYLADDYFRKTGKRDKANMMFYSALGGIFGVPKYAKVLDEICNERNLTRKFRQNLVEVKPETKEAIFENLDTKELSSVNYSLLHVTPPQGPAKNLAPLADQTGFVDVDKYTLQHVKYSNVFSLGDCSSLPTSKTAAAITSEHKVLYDNLRAVMDKKPLKGKYDGYTSCPLATGNGKVVLAEFDYDGKPLETFPFDQGKERRSMFFMKTTVIPWIYWNMMLTGYWPGPAWFRKMTFRT